MDPQNEKLEALSERIRLAEAGAQKKVEPKTEPSSTRNAGFDLAGSIIGGGVIGYFLDRAFGTTPWCLVGMVCLGFLSGITGIWFSMQRPQK